MLKNLTPEFMRCSHSMACPGVYQREDGMLLIIGKDGHAASIEHGIKGAMDERAILIHPDLLADYVKQAKDNPNA